MIPYSKLLEQARTEAEPFGGGEAAVVVTVYHPESMDEPHVVTHTFTEAELATSSNRSLVDSVSTMIEARLLDLLSKWRGA